MWFVNSLRGHGISGLASRSAPSFLGRRLALAVLITLDRPLIRGLLKALLGGDENDDGVESRLPRKVPSSSAGGVLTGRSCNCMGLVNWRTHWLRRDYYRSRDRKAMSVVFLGGIIKRSRGLSID